MKTLNYFLISISLLVGALSVNAAHYYLDAERGDDAAVGTSPSQAWKTLDKLNALELQAGDFVFLRTGSVFEGQLKPKGSGTFAAPIILTAYGKGPKPRIDGQGAVRATVFLKNLSHWVVRGIEITNTGAEPKANRLGVYLLADNAGVVKNITLSNLFIHDVNGVISKDEGGGSGILWEVISKKTPTRFEGLLIEDCHILRCDRDGIKGRKQPWDDLSYLSTNVVVRGNLLEHIGGDGIVPIGTDGALIEFNRIYEARDRFDPSTKEVSQYAGPSVGIWPWSSTNTLIRFNEVWGYRGTFDGQGYDSDFNCDGSTFEYNLSANNAGGFFLICNWAKHQDSGQSIGNSNTTIRHNISLNDHIRAFVINGPVSDVLIEKNIIYNTIEPKFQLLVDTPWGRFAESVKVRDNLFYTTGEAHVYQGTWGGGGMGLWKYKGPLNSKTISMQNNAYSNAHEHSETGMQTLAPEQTLGSLIKELEKARNSNADFREMLRFLRGSKYWEQIESVL